MDAALVARQAPAHVVVRLSVEHVGLAADAPGRATMALRDAAASGELYVVVTHVPTEREYPIEVSWAHLNGANANAAKSALDTAAARGAHAHPLKVRELPCALHHLFAIPTTAAGDTAGPEFAVALVRHRSNARIVLAECLGNDTALDFRGATSGACNAAEVRLMDSKALRKDAASASCWCTVSIASHAVADAAALGTATRRAKMSQTLSFGVALPPAVASKAEHEAALAAARADPDALAAAKGVLSEVVSVDVGACDPSTSGCWCSFPVFGADSAATSAALEAMRSSPPRSAGADVGAVRAAASVFGSMLVANLVTTKTAIDDSAGAVFEATVTSQPQLLPAAAGSLIAVRQGMFVRDEFEEWLARQPGGSSEDEDASDGDSVPDRRIVCRVAAAGALATAVPPSGMSVVVPTRPSLNAQLQALFRERFRWIKAHKCDDRATLDAADALAQLLVCRAVFTVLWDEPATANTSAQNGPTITYDEQLAVADARCVLLTRKAVCRARERAAEAKAAGAVNGAAAASLPRSVSVLASHKSTVGRLSSSLGELDMGAFKASLEQASLPKMVASNNGAPVGDVSDVPPAIIHYLCTFAAFGSVVGPRSSDVDRFGSARLDVAAATAALQPSSPPGWSTLSGGASAGVNFGLASDEHLLFWAAANAERTLAEASLRLQGLCYLGAVANATLRSPVLGPLMLCLLWLACLHPAAGVPALGAGLGVVALAVFRQFKADMATTSSDDASFHVAEWQNNCTDELHDVATARSVSALVAASWALQATAGAVGPSVGTPAVLVGRLVVAVCAVALLLWGRPLLLYLDVRQVPDESDDGTPALGNAVALAVTILLFPLPQRQNPPNPPRYV